MRAEDIYILSQLDGKEKHLVILMPGTVMVGTDELFLAYLKVTGTCPTLPTQKIERRYKNY